MTRRKVAYKSREQSDRIRKNCLLSVYLKWLQSAKLVPLYGLAHLVAVVDAKIEGYKNPHAGNIFEIWANKTAGLEPEDKIWK